MFRLFVKGLDLIEPVQQFTGCPTENLFNLFNLFFDGETFLTFLFFWKTFLNLFFYEKKTFFSGFLWKMY